MKILDVLHKDAILVNLKAHDKKSVLEELTAPVAETTRINHSKLVRMLMEREQLGTTGIGGGIAIPHGKLKELESVVICIGLSRKGISFDAMDKKPVNIFFLLFTPEGATELHLTLLSQISKLLKNNIFKERLLEASDPETVCAVIEEFDQ